MGKYVCIDIGGTAIKYGLLDEHAALLEQKERPTEAMLGGQAVLEKVKETAGQYCQAGGVEGICISTTGMVDPYRGSILYANENMPAYQGICLKEEMEHAFGVPCEVENDVNCAGLAEYWNGAAKECDNVLCLTVGTGIGACAILNGKLLRGASFSACEVGYMDMGWAAFEEVASTTALVRQVAKKKHEEIFCWNGKKIFEYAEKGDKICLEALAKMADWLGRGIANICYVLNPEVVVLGGGVMQRESILTSHVRGAVNRHLLPVISSNMRIELAHHHNMAGMLGAWYYYKTMHP